MEDNKRCPGQGRASEGEDLSTCFHILKNCLSGKKKPKSSWAFKKRSTTEPINWETVIDSLKTDLKYLCEYERTIARCPFAGVPTYEPCFVLNEMSCKVGKLERQMRRKKTPKQNLAECEEKLKKHTQLLQLVRCMRILLCEETTKQEGCPKKKKLLYIAKTLACVEAEICRMSKVLYRECCSAKQDYLGPGTCPCPRVKSSRGSDSDRSYQSSQGSHPQSEPKIKDSRDHRTVALKDSTDRKSKEMTLRIEDDGRTKSSRNLSHKTFNNVTLKASNQVNAKDPSSRNSSKSSKDRGSGLSVRISSLSQSDRESPAHKSSSCSPCASRKSKQSVCPCFPPTMEEAGGSQPDGSQPVGSDGKKAASASPSMNGLAVRGFDFLETANQQGFEVSGFKLVYTKNRVTVEIPPGMNYMEDMTEQVEPEDSDGSSLSDKVSFSRQLPMGVAQSSLEEGPDGSIRFMITYERDYEMGHEEGEPDSGQTPLDNFEEEVKAMSKIWYDSAQQLCQTLVERHHATT